jgi:pimeloyl-ACP methyl ester carboxylesterase
MVFAHGFGCDQNMWRFVAPAFEKDFMTLVFDHVGAGGSDLSAYDRTKYSSLSGYADDVVEIGRELGLQDAVFVGHSVSSMIGVLAARKAPGMFGKLVLVGRRPATSTTKDTWAVQRPADRGAPPVSNRTMGWSTQMAPMIMGNPDRPELGRANESFCRTDPESQSVRPGDIHLRQQTGPGRRHCSDPCPPVQRGHHRLPGGRRVRQPQPSEQPDDRLESDRPLSEPERAGRGHRGDANFCLVGTTGLDFQDMIENAPCGYITLHASGRVDHVNQTFLEWSATPQARWSASASAIS